MVDLSSTTHLRNTLICLMKVLGYGHEYKYNPNYHSGHFEPTC